MEHIIRIDRFKFTKDTTIGKIYINDKYFGFTLEDTVRPYGIKVKHHTAIPQNWSAFDKHGSVDDLYKVGITFSERFHREMPVIYNIEPELNEAPYILNSGGIEFKGDRFHGGNTHLNTSGCVIVAESWNNNDMIHGSLEEELTKQIKEMLKTCQVYLLIRNFAQKD